MKWKWYIWDWTQLALKGTSKFHEKVIQIPMDPISAIIPSLPTTCLALWVIPYNQLTEEEKFGAWFTKRNESTCPQIGNDSPATPFWDILEGQQWRTIHLVGSTWIIVPGCTFCSEKKKWPEVGAYPDSWSVVSGLAGWSRL